MQIIIDILLVTEMYLILNNINKKAIHSCRMSKWEPTKIETFI